MGALITVEAATCAKCGHPKPRSEFYDSEFLKGKPRCKPCFRERIDAKNKRRGRQSTSMSFSEVVWWARVLRALPTSELRDLARRPEYTTLARKNASMLARALKAKEGLDR